MDSPTAQTETEEGIILMERPLDGWGEHLYDEEEDYNLFRHEQFFSLKGNYNFGKFKDGGIRAEDPKHHRSYVQKDMRVFKRKFIDQARIELEQEAKQAKNDELMVNMDNPQRDYYLFNKNCLIYVNDIISRAEALAEKAGESLYIKT